MMMLILMYIVVFLLFFLLFNFRWCVDTIREIAHPKNQGGYTKLIQIGLISVLTLIFVGIVVYYIFNPAKVDRIDVILTVVVGWLGAIIGRFFGERAMENLEEKRQIGVKKMDLLMEEYKMLIPHLIDKLKKK